MGKDLEFFPGVTEWFGRINRIGNELDLKIEHYIISSGLHEIIEGSSFYLKKKENENIRQSMGKQSLTELNHDQRRQNKGTVHR